MHPLFLRANNWTEEMAHVSQSVSCLSEKGFTETSGVLQCECCFTYLVHLDKELAIVE